jgi:hypothetical protein
MKETRILKVDNFRNHTLYYPQYLRNHWFWGEEWVNIIKGDGYFMCNRDAEIAIERFIKNNYSTEDCGVPSVIKYP